MASCNPYQSTCGMTGIEVQINPYLPDSQLFTQYIVANYDTGERVFYDSYLQEVANFRSIYDKEDEIAITAVASYPVQEVNPVPEPPIVGLILVGYLFYWLMRTK